MTAAASGGDTEVRNCLLEPGDWDVEFIRSHTIEAFGGKFVLVARLMSGPYRNDVPRWHRDQSELAKVPPGYDDPAHALVQRYYTARVREGRLVAKEMSDLSRDLYRLTGEEVPRLDRFPISKFRNTKARVRIATVTKDHQRLPCPPYSTIRAILGPAAGETLSTILQENSDSVSS